MDTIDTNDTIFIYGFDARKITSGLEFMTIEGTSYVTIIGHQQAYQKPNCFSICFMCLQAPHGFGFLLAGEIVNKYKNKKFHKLLFVLPTNGVGIYLRIY